MTPCWMISLVSPPPLEKHPCPHRPRECLLLILQPMWLQAAQAPLSGPLAIISLCPLVDSCSSLLQRDAEYLSLRPPEPLSRQLHLFLSRRRQDAALEICMRQSDLSLCAACVPSSHAACAASPGSQAAPRPLLSPPRVTRPRFHCVDLNKICSHLTVRL